MEIWSGDNFTGNKAECTGSCDISNLGSVGNDRARSAKCSCAQPTTTTEMPTTETATTEWTTTMTTDWTHTFSTEESREDICAAVKPSERVDCANLFPGNHAVHNKAGCESLGCCHSPIDVPGPWCHMLSQPITKSPGKLTGLT